MTIVVIAIEPLDQQTDLPLVGTADLELHTTEAFASITPIERSFEAASVVAGTVDCDVTLAGHCVRLRCAGLELMESISRTFGHLVSGAVCDPELTVHLWDSASTQVAGPPLPLVQGEQAPGAFFYYSDACLRIGYQLGTSGDPRVLDVYPHAPNPAVSILDAAGDRAWYWVEDARRIPYWEQATPILYILDWWLRDRGIHQLHAGAVGTPHGGMLLVGKSGSGKSTCSLSVLGSSLLYAGDDYVAVSLDPEPRVHSLFSAGKLMPDHVNRLPLLQPALANTGQLDVEKAVVYVHEHWPAGITSGFPLRAIAIPRVTPGLVEARAEEVSPAVGLAALAPSTVFQMHTRGQDSLARSRRLAQAVPSFSLQIGSDVASIPQVMADLLERLALRA